MLQLIIVTAKEFCCLYHAQQKICLKLSEFRLNRHMEQINNLIAQRYCVNSLILRDKFHSVRFNTPIGTCLTICLRRIFCHFFLDTTIVQMKADSSHFSVEFLIDRSIEKFRQKQILFTCCLSLNNITYFLRHLCRTPTQLSTFKKSPFVCAQWTLFSINFSSIHNSRFHCPCLKSYICARQTIFAHSIHLLFNRKTDHCTF